MYLLVKGKERDRFAWSRNHATHAEIAGAVGSCSSTRAGTVSSCSPIPPSGILHTTSPCIQPVGPEREREREREKERDTDIYIYIIHCVLMYYLRAVIRVQNNLSTSDLKKDVCSPLPTLLRSRQYGPLVSHPVSL